MTRRSLFVVRAALCVLRAVQDVRASELSRMAQIRTPQGVTPQGVRDHTRGQVYLFAVRSLRRSLQCPLGRIFS
jgi:hypothetical protein